MTLTAIITGASSGIGAAIAEKFAEEGINVVLAARSEEKLSETAKTIQEKGNKNVLPDPTDVSKQADVEHLCEQGLSQIGAVDISVNNAGAMVSAEVTDGEMP